MKKSYSKQDKEKIIKKYEGGVSITSIHNSTGIARSTKTLDALCYVLDCEVSDIIKFEKE